MNRSEFTFRLPAEEFPEIYQNSRKGFLGTTIKTTFNQSNLSGIVSTHQGDHPTQKEKEKKAA